MINLRQISYDKRIQIVTNDTEKTRRRRRRGSLSQSKNLNEIKYKYNIESTVVNASVP